ncbi:MAG TPA: PP2C family protein-serine/threonine phosphatase [Planctomycetaceae bacterium]|jgi:sigma-B regulation protein RsbU (phosphoserine phosphatase)|nr:PP2C family protein-serine/threonine phosphatase [Planctomycetaceae bacterium]
MLQCRRAPGRLKNGIELLRRHSRIMGDIQRSLLPDALPIIARLELAASNRPAQIVGGDYYDFVRSPDGRWFLFLADVSGHGVPAAVIAAALHGIVHTKLQHARSPAQFLHELNRYLAIWYTLKDHGFATAFLGLYDPRDRSLTYASAGHLPARLISSSRRRVELLERATGYPLGIVDVNPFEDNVQHLQSGDHFVLCTDGITEVLSPEGTLFGSQRLDQALASAPKQPQAILSSLFSTIDCFSGGRPLLDDQTVVVARVV